MIHNHCPLCDSADISPELQCVDHFISEEVFDLYRCSACKFLFTYNYPAEDKIGKYYESDEYISHSDTSQGVVNTLYQVARKFMLKRKRNLIRNVTGIKKGTLLDIGSGTGHFANVMKESGWQLSGIEINRKALDYSIQTFNLDVASPEQIPSLKSESFDCITLWHVLEHFHDKYKYASYISRLLKPDGICVVALPNSNSSDAKHYREFWAAYDVPRHLWHFSPDTFRLFCKKAGLEVVSIKTLPLDVFYISALSEKYKGTSIAFLRGIIKAIFFAFLSFLNKNKSSSLIYILRKSVEQPVSN